MITIDKEVKNVKCFVEVIVLDSIDYLEINPSYKKDTLEYIFSQLPYFDSKKQNFYGYCCQLSLSFLRSKQ